MEAAAIGAVIVAGFLPRGPEDSGPDFVLLLVFCVGFCMLWGFLLALGIRKLQRMMRPANAE